MTTKSKILVVSWILLFLSGLVIALDWSMIATALTTSGAFSLEANLADHQTVKHTLFLAEGLGLFAGILVSFREYEAAGWVRGTFLATGMVWGLFCLTHMMVAGLIS